MANSEFKYCNKVQCQCCAKLLEELEKARRELQSLKEIIIIIEVNPTETRRITPKSPSKIEDGRWSVVRPKQLKQFKIPLVVNRFVMPLEMFPVATKEEGKSTIAYGAAKEKPRKHKVLLLGDSQLRGCADLLKQNLNKEFGVSGLVKSGAKTSDILATNMEENMSEIDVIVVYAGTNDISKNSAKEGLSTIINFVRRNSHTNIMVMEVLRRHDLVDWSCVNKEVKSFNRHLAKRLKLYKHVSVIRVNLNRQHFTRHGLHTNSKGKREMCQQVAELIQQKLEAVVNALPLKYKEYTVHDEAAVNHGKQEERTSANPSPNCMAELVQQKLRAVVNALPLKYKEDTVHDKAAVNHGKQEERTSANPSPNCMAPSTGAQQQKVRMSTRRRRPPVKLSKDFL
ncbi:hypothetical protein B7P43_G04390 [Cryptotermes secundus]|uniref:Uncharacterized protein n=1 Tax=Cryptotermes secundus TaxID=105785 RepID=A0A2J7PZW2_9NEOP|nr:hypothetical protein B7P43_G04390 [Cryptotermes secundus]